LNNLRWFEVVDTRGQIEENQVAYWQVTIKIGFTVNK
jgi:flavin-binding protein dodecin